MALRARSAKRAMLLNGACCLMALWVLLEPAVAEPAVSTGAPSSTQAPSQSKEKRSREDIMFGNQQNKPASGMVDDIFRVPETSSKNSTQLKVISEHVSEKPGSAGGRSGTEHRHTLAELPDRLDYYDYVQPEPSELSSPASSPAASIAAADEEEEEAQRNFLDPQDQPSFGSQRLLPAPAQMAGRNEMGDYPSWEDYDGNPERSLMYQRRKRGVFRTLRSPLEDLLSSSRGPFRRRRASSVPMRIKRDAASNELLNWLALLHKSQAAGNSRRRNYEEIAFQELQGLDPEPIDLSEDSGYLYEPLTDDEELGDEDVLPVSFREPLPLPEEGPDGDPLDWDFPVRPPVQRRSSGFYPLDYRYVILPGARKRASLVAAPGGRFGPMREVNRWPDEPQAGRWGHFPLLPMAQHRLPMAVRRAPPPQDSDTEHLFALASLLASPGGSSRDDTLELDLEPGRQRSTRAAPFRG